MIKIAWYTAVILATLTALVILWQFSQAVILFFLSFTLAAAFRPLLEQLTRRGLKRSLALVLTYALFLISVAAIFMLGNGRIIADMQNATDDLINRYQLIKNAWLLGNNSLLANLAAQMPPTQTIYTSLSNDTSGAVMNTILGFAQGTFTFLAQVAMVVALSMYWSADQVRFERLWLSLIRLNARRRIRIIWQAVESGVGAYIRRETVLSLILGLGLWLIYLMLGIRYPTLLAFVGALARLIPWLGFLVVILLPIIVGSTQGLLMASVAAAGSILLLILIEITLGRRIFHAQKTNSLLLVIVVIAMAESFGLIGALVATVLTVAIQIILKNTLVIPANRNLAAENEITMENLQNKVSGIENELVENSGNYISEMMSLVERLKSVLEKALIKNNEG